MVSLIALVMVGLGVTMFLGPMGGGGGFEMPTEFEIWRTQSSSFQFEYPKGWETGGTKMTASVKKGSISIKVRDSVQGSLKADIIAGPTAVDGEKNPKLPVDIMHEVMKEDVVKEFTNYSEFDMGRLESKPKNSHYSQYSHSSFFGGERAGYRLTMLNAKYQLNILLECDADEFDQVKPLFEKIMSTFNVNSN
ncbi:MAG: hypothetical protein R3C11_14730 [Planctomycetaceae bacterium]